MEGRGGVAVEGGGQWEEEEELEAEIEIVKLRPHKLHLLIDKKARIPKPKTVLQQVHSFTPMMLMLRAEPARSLAACAST